jgi:hypothetical protein
MTTDVQHQVTREQVVEVLERAGFDESYLDESYTQLGMGGQDCLAITLPDLGAYTAFAAALVSYIWDQEDANRDPGLEIKWFRERACWVPLATGSLWYFPNVAVMKGE